MMILQMKHFMIFLIVLIACSSVIGASYYPDADSTGVNGVAILVHGSAAVLAVRAA